MVYQSKVKLIYNNLNTMKIDNMEILSCSGRLKSLFKSIKKCGLFDPDFYIRQSGCSSQGMDPFLHFCQYGANQLLSPSVNFDSKKYLDSNPDVLDSNLDPLSHYLIYGKAENRPIWRIGNNETPAQLTPYQCGSFINVNWQKRRIAVVALNSMQNKIDAALVWYLKKLKEVADATMLVCASIPLPSEIFKVRHLVNMTICGISTATTCEAWEFGLRKMLRSGAVLRFLEALLCVDSHLPLCPIQNLLNSRSESQMDGNNQVRVWSNGSDLFPDVALAIIKDDLICQADSPGMLEVELHNALYMIDAHQNERLFLSNPWHKAASIFRNLPVWQEDKELEKEAADIPEHYQENLIHVKGQNPDIANLIQNGSAIGNFPDSLQPFSILLPLTHDLEAARNAIDSVLAQTAVKFEIIAVAVEYYQTAISQLQNQYSQEIEAKKIVLLVCHGSEVEARNLGLKSAKYNWVLHLSEEARMPCGFLLRSALFLLAHPDATAFYAPVLDSSCEFELNLDIERQFLGSITGLAHSNSKNIRFDCSVPSYMADRRFAEAVSGRRLIPRHKNISLRPNFFEPEPINIRRKANIQPELTIVVTGLPRAGSIDFGSFGLHGKGYVRTFILVDPDSTEAADRCASIPPGVWLVTAKSLCEAMETAHSDFVYFSTFNELMALHKNMDSQFSILQTNQNCIACHSLGSVLDGCALSDMEELKCDQLIAINGIPLSGLMCVLEAAKVFPQKFACLAEWNLTLCAWLSLFGEILIPNVRPEYHPENIFIDESSIFREIHIRRKLKHILSGSLHANLDKSITEFESKLSLKKCLETVCNPVI